MVQGWPAWLAVLLVTVRGQLVEQVVWGDWDSVSCYSCGLAGVDPEQDNPGSYGIDPGEGKKMYNHR